jgi:hypothetical protein
MLQSWLATLSNTSRVLDAVLQRRRPRGCRIRRLQTEISLDDLFAQIGAGCRCGLVSLVVSLVHHSYVGSCEAADAPEVPPGHRPFSL